MVESLWIKKRVQVVSFIWKSKKMVSEFSRFTLVILLSV